MNAVSAYDENHELISGNDVNTINIGATASQCFTYNKSTDESTFTPQ